MNGISERISRLRELMMERGIYAYIIPTDDFHGSEYVGEYFRLREYLSGFTGSAGTLVITDDEARLWTDGRYFIQAEQQLVGSGIELMRSRENGVPDIEEYLEKTLPDGSVLGFDGRTVSAAFAGKLNKKLSEKGIRFSAGEDLGGMVWEDRPPLSKKPVFSLAENLCGVSAEEKIGKIREKLRGSLADCLVVSALDEIAWTLNLRGGDVDYNPVFLAYMAIFEDEILLFADREIFDEKITDDLNAIGVNFYPYEDVYDPGFWLDKTVWLDPKAVNFSLVNAARKYCRKVIEKKCPIELMKAVKNPVEISAEKYAHLMDGVAVTRFMYRLKKSVERITEISAAEILEGFRRETPDIFKAEKGEYLGQSFEPIMAYGDHAAIVHYKASEESDRDILPQGMLLSDTGGHYLHGTTDITRTFVLGPLTEEERRAFTVVLAGHLELLYAVFPKGVYGSALDAIARKPLWKHGMEFNHGTGHGVGFLLNVHEGPQNISWRKAGGAPLEAGMITSDEPGYYVKGKFGIRHESLMLCRQSDMEGFLCFEPLTLVPFDRDGIDPTLLTDDQIWYLNDYHALVYEKISPYLTKDEAKWLKKITEPI